MTPEKLKEVLEKHALWRKGDPSGSRANLPGANLAGANLADADLADAYLADADLAGANLAGADLADANLARAYLAGANLAGADLARADLAGADLADANLARAYLADANLAGAYLAGANLADAYLAGADLAGAYLAGAYLAGAYLADANLADARSLPANIEAKDPPEPYQRVTSAEGRKSRAERYRERNPTVPVVENLDQKILEAITAPGCRLEMGAWHTCETTHCRAGWAIHLAGKAGYDLEKALGEPELAGRAIYIASTGRSAYFYGSNESAMADIERRAEES